ncbi:MAG: DUF3795 domain-containing protein [Theionarchaea archaeon]|nr:DUF3795 domain-containing protein [Theionarchaea archaeon]
MPEGKIIAYCGRICDECPAYISKRTDDDELRKKSAEKWSSERFALEQHDINCDGCTAGGELFKYCMRCKVRECGRKRKVGNCAHCADYSCETLERVWRRLLFPHAQKVLDEIRKHSNTERNSALSGRKLR